MKESSYAVNEGYLGTYLYPPQHQTERGEDSDCLLPIEVIVSSIRNFHAICTLHSICGHYWRRIQALLITEDGCKQCLI